MIVVLTTKVTVLINMLQRRVKSLHVSGMRRNDYNKLYVSVLPNLTDSLASNAVGNGGGGVEGTS